MEKMNKPTIYQVALKKRQEIAKGTMAFYFDRPAGFTFKAGQFIDLSLLNLSASDPQGHTRALTLASAPSPFSFSSQPQEASKMPDNRKR